MKQIVLKKNVLASNKELAMENRVKLQESGIMTFNIFGSPGAGKTSLLEMLLKELKSAFSFAVIEGDLYTAKDAERIEAQGIPVIQVNTGGGCHLDADMIRKAMTELGTDNLDCLIIENVGNLVCPASYDLGEDCCVTVMSTTEGNDKPLKYPAMFQKSDLVILNKIDLIPHTDFDTCEFYRDIEQLNPNAEIIELSCREGFGVKALVDYFKTSIVTKATEERSA